MFGKKIITKKGKEFTFLNPSEKSAKYSIELKENLLVTNNLTTKLNKNGKAQFLTNTQRAYRSGYLDARKDNAKAYKANLKNNITK